MADRIIISTQWLNDCSKALRSVQNTLNNARSSLKYVDLSREAGGDKSITFTARSLRCGARIYGNEVDEVLNSAERGIDALNSDISDLIAAIAKSIDGYERAEVTISQLVNGIDYDVTLSVYNSGDVVYARYEVKYYTGADVINKNRDQWNSENRFKDTQYDNMIREALRNLLVNNADYRKSRWELLETDEERKRFIKDFIEALQAAYGTELTGDVVFVDPNDFVDGEDYHIYTVNGVEVRYPHNADGGYSNSVDSIFVKLYDGNGNLKSYEELIDTLCHENRHNLQHEIVEADNLDRYDGVNGEDYDDIVAAREAWIENTANYEDGVLTDEERNTRAEEIKNEMSWLQKKIYSDEDRRVMAGFEEYEEYAGQENEVDARYTGEYAKNLVKEQRKVENKEKRDAKIAEIKEEVDEFTGKVKEVFDMSRKGWDTLLNT